MNISEFCIRRPVATLLMSAALIVAGIFAYGYLPVAALPNADFPVINVNASLPGADPTTMSMSVATPLIKQFSTIAGIDSISASSKLGSTSITLQFQLTRNIDAAATDVQSAIDRVARQLPKEMTTAPSYRKVNPAAAPILLLALGSKTVPLTQLDAFAQQVISPSLSTLDGVAQVVLSGSRKYAVRIQIDPSLLAARGISIDQLQSAITAANTSTPLGTLQTSNQQIIITANTDLTDAAAFANIIIPGSNGGAAVRLGDVTKVVDSVENLQSFAQVDGTPSITLEIQRQPSANTVDVVNSVLAKLPSFQAQLPPTASLTTLNDRSTSIRASVNDVQFTLLLTIGLVVLVIFLFLRKVSATIIPAVAVPISLIATLGAMYLFGFSIDNISLMALTLSVGLVVDDAIVMLENIVRHMEEEGLNAFDAAIKGSREIGFTILSISISLIAVFIPVLLMGGIVGRLFNEFGVVVATSIVASMFVSLTLTPMLASRILPKIKHQPGNDDPNAEQRGFFGLLHRGYDAGLKFCLRFKPLVILVFIATAAGTVYLVDIAPKGFFPQEDIGQLRISTRARQDISYANMLTLMSKVNDTVSKQSYVVHVAEEVGGNTLNAGQFYVQLKDKSARPDLATVVSDLRRKLGNIPGITSFIQPIQNLNIGSISSASSYQVVVQALTQADTNNWSTKLTAAMTADPAHFLSVSSDLQNNVLQATMVIDRAKASSLGVSVDTLRSTISSDFTATQVSTIYNSGDSYAVMLEMDPSIPVTSNSITKMLVRSTTGALVPIDTFATIQMTAGPLTVNQLGQLPAVTISYDLPTGEALGDSLTQIAQLQTQIGMPVTVSVAPYGSAQTFQQSLSNQGFLILGAILVIYILLGILYESFIHPITILAGLPSAVIGALLALRIFGLDLSVIAIIGILMLIGIVKKNAIMMIDVALTLKREGKSPVEAIHQACLMRFRPIMMTTMAALMATLPIAAGFGASAELRQPLGVAVVGGLIVSQALTLFITPVIFVYMEQFSGLFRRKRKAEPENQDRDDDAANDMPKALGLAAE
ncbi:MAG TPA: efflux RND transporter permease subunit [Arsenicitalea sp.]|nr:efflux RND transporter permease subunit [Arsenicitalea sp.]